MKGQHLVFVEHQVAPLIEGQFPVRGQAQPPDLPYLLEPGWNGIGIDRFGLFALQAQDQGLVGAVALAGRTQ